MIRLAVRMVALTVIALVAAFAIAMAISGTNPSLQPQVLGQAQAEAARAAAERGESSFCGVAIPEEWREGVASGRMSFVVVTTESSVPLAACLRDQGYLSKAGFTTVLSYEDARKWRWWEKALWALLLVVVVAGAGYLLFRGQARRPANPS